MDAGRFFPALSFVTVVSHTAGICRRVAGQFEQFGQSPSPLFHWKSLLCVLGWHQYWHRGRLSRPWCCSPFLLLAPSGNSLCSVALAALLVAGLVGVGAVRSSWAVSSSLAEAIVSMGDTSSEGSAAFVSEPACSSSVLPIMIGEVGEIPLPDLGWQAPVLHSEVKSPHSLLSWSREANFCAGSTFLCVLCACGAINTLWWALPAAAILQQTWPRGKA